MITKIQLHCAYCNSLFERVKAQVNSIQNRNGKDFCNKLCHDNHQKLLTASRLLAKEKECSKCNQLKSFDCFSKDKHSPDGRTFTCKLCRKSIIKEWQKKNPEKVRKLSKRFYENNKRKILDKNAQYRKKNKKQIRKWTNEWSKNRKKTNIQYRLAGILRKRVKNAVKSENKFHPSLQLIGCDAKEFQTHIESQWQKGMSWENHGTYGWHIDHIIPVNTFDLTIEEEQKKCFHYTNCRPLWAKENLSRPVDGSDVKKAPIFTGAFKY